MCHIEAIYAYFSDVGCCVKCGIREQYFNREIKVGRPRKV